MDIMERSIGRAQKLLHSKGNIENYISFKIVPVNGGCCCFHCWPNTWDAINRDISSYGHLEDEGDVALGDGNEKFVLECHESGPEIIVQIAIASASLVTNITNLILNIIKYRQKERSVAQFKLTSRKYKNSKIIDETILEIEYPISSKSTNILSQKIKDILSTKSSK